MRKHMMLLSAAMIALFVFTACSTNAAEEPNATGQTTPATQASQQDNQANEQASQEPQSALPDTSAQAQEGQTDTLNRIREHDEWTADILERWEDILSVTVDEIFDHVRAQSSFNYGFERDFEGIDVSEWAAAVGNTSNEFMSLVHMAYNATRSVDVAHIWAAELDMTVHELGDYVFGGNDSQHFADELGVEWGEFQTVLAGVGNALWNERVRSYANAESVEIVRGWANELGMTLDEFIDDYNGFYFNIIAASETLGVAPTEFTLTMHGVTAFLNPNE